MAYKQKKPTFFSSALKQAHWYKIDGKNVTKEQYVNYQNKPGNMEGGGKTTSDPDASGNKAKIQKNREKNQASKRPTVLTKEQTELLNKRTNKKAPLKATRGYNMLMAGAGGKKYSKEGGIAGFGSNQYTSGDLSYRGDFDTDIMMDAAKKPSKQTIENNGGGNGGNGDNGGNTSSSLDINWPKLFKPGTSDKQKEYNTTACPDFKPKKIDPKTGLTIQPGSRRRKRANRNWLRNR
tara:strand:+ start:1491 stop:2198 length:708 start_codon:yes stop_codon:yes gene_type:complete